MDVAMLEVQILLALGTSCSQGGQSRRRRQSILHKQVQAISPGIPASAASCLKLLMHSEVEAFEL